MSYLGTVELKESDIRRFDVTSSTSATHTLTWTAPSEQSLIVTINGVKQQNNYTVSGTTLTLDAALIATDAMEVIGIVDVGTTITPAQGSVNTDQLANVSVTTAKLAADSVTSAKIVDGAVANADLADMAANTVKVRDANSSGVPSDKALATTEILIGDGTGFTAAALSGDATMTNAGAVTIANDAVNAAKLADDAVDTAAVADNAVTLAKMAGLVRGKIIYGDASGDPAALTVGGANEVLTSDGTDVSWAAATAADNTPSFGAVPSAGTTVAYNTFTKITLGTELWDTDSAFDPTTNYRFTVPTGEAGKYFFTYKINWDAGSGDGDDMLVVLYKNGVRTVYTEDSFEKSTPGSNESFFGQTSCIMDLAAADYLELYCYQIGPGSTSRTTSTNKTFFSGFKLAGV